MREKGRVVEVNGGNITIAIGKESACGGNCASCGGCGQKVRTAKAINSVNAKIGDVVEIELCERKILSAAFIVYILPLLLFLPGYYLPRIFTENNVICTIAAFVFMIIGFFLTHAYDKQTNGKYLPEAVFIVSETDKCTENDDIAT